MTRPIYFFAFLVLCSGAGAVSLAPSSLEREVRNADFIGHVRVTEGRALFFQNLGRNLPCGGVYKADVIRSLKGEARALEFGINFNLMLTPGREYLLFVQFESGMDIEMAMFDPADYEECSSGLPATMARWRPSSLVDSKISEGEEVQVVTHPYGVIV